MCCSQHLSYMLYLLRPSCLLRSDSNRWQQGRSATQTLKDSLRPLPWTASSTGSVTQWLFSVSCGLWKWKLIHWYLIPWCSVSCWTLISMHGVLFTMIVLYVDEYWCLANILRACPLKAGYSEFEEIKTVNWQRIHVWRLISHDNFLTFVSSSRPKMRLLSRGGEACGIKLWKSTRTSMHASSLTRAVSSMPPH